MGHVDPECSEAMVVNNAIEEIMYLTTRYSNEEDDKRVNQLNINSSTKISSPLDLVSYFQNYVINRNGPWHT